ncbi:hypothetical protein NA57DRAFT_53164 [Rhizodiscina lignyota]|uniref:Mid2 domain-containing protein n=1 Tax=Rhizodiscina lignyota TaxID=1504668 RepID=A0A9P4MBA4_9PEZI|nr:hypothetical protein NA57DRAFT_53164 [Rhizodiscina lignyota]
MFFAALVFFISIFAIITAADDSNSFISPPSNAGPSENVVWGVGDVKAVQWKTTSQHFQIELWQQYPPSFGAGAHNTSIIYSHSSSRSQSSAYTYKWTVTSYDADLTWSNEFYFFLEAIDDPDLNFTCHYFNLMDEVQTTNSLRSRSSTLSTHIQTVSTTTHSERSTSSSSTASSTLSSAAASNTSTAVSGSSTSSSALRIGLGVGLGLGIPVVLALGIWFGLKTARGYRGQGSAGPGARPRDLWGSIDRVPGIE